MNLEAMDSPAETVAIGPGPLSRWDLLAVARHGAGVALTREALAASSRPVER